MHDYRRNGKTSWEPPSFGEILLNRLDRVDQHMSEVRQDLGGLKAGQRITLDAVGKNFELHREMDGRVTTIESELGSIKQAVKTQAPPFGPPPTAHQSPPPSAKPGMLESIRDILTAARETLPRVREVLTAALLLAAALGLVETKPPEQHAAASKSEQLPAP